MNLGKWPQPGYNPGVKTKSKGKRKGKWTRNLPQNYRAFNVRKPQYELDCGAPDEDEHKDLPKRNPVATDPSQCEETEAASDHQGARDSRGRRGYDKLPTNPMNPDRAKKRTTKALTAPGKQAEKEVDPWSAQFRTEGAGPNTSPTQRDNPLKTGQKTHFNPLVSTNEADDSARPTHKPPKIPQYKQPKALDQGSGGEATGKPWYATPQRAAQIPTSRYKRTDGPWLKKTEHSDAPPERKIPRTQKEERQPPARKQSHELPRKSILPPERMPIQTQNTKAPMKKQPPAPPTGGPKNRQNEGSAVTQQKTPRERESGPVNAAKTALPCHDPSDNQAMTNTQSKGTHKGREEHPPSGLHENPRDPENDPGKTTQKASGDTCPGRTPVAPKQKVTSPTNVARPVENEGPLWTAPGDQGAEELTLSSGSGFTNGENAKSKNGTGQRGSSGPNDQAFLQEKLAAPSTGQSREEVLTSNTSKATKKGKESTSGVHHARQEGDEDWWCDGDHSCHNLPAFKNTNMTEEESSAHSDATNEPPERHELGQDAEPADIHSPHIHQKKGAKTSPDKQPVQGRSENYLNYKPGDQTLPENTDGQRSSTTPSGNEGQFGIPSQKYKASGQETIISISSEDPSQEAADHQHSLEANIEPQQKRKTDKVQTPAYQHQSDPDTPRRPWTPPLPPTMEFHLSPEETAMRITRLFNYLGGIPDPLHTEARRSPFAPLIPYEWFFIIDPRAYSQQSRHFARAMLLRDPALISSFVRADWAILLQIPDVTVQITCNFFYHKYALGPDEAATLANSNTVPRLMALASEILSSRSQASLMGLAVTQGPGTPLFSRRFSHHQPPESCRIRPRTDWLVVATEKLEERVQNGIRERTNRETSSETGTPGESSPSTQGRPDSEELKPSSSEGGQEEDNSSSLPSQAIPSSYCFPGPTDPQDEHEDYLEDENDEE